MDRRDLLERIADHCLSARRLAEQGQEKMVGQLLDMLLLELGQRMVAQEAAPIITLPAPSPEAIQARSCSIPRRARARRTRPTSAGWQRLGGV